MTMPNATAPATQFFTFLPDNLVLEYGLEVATFVARMANWVRYKLTVGEVDENGTAWIFNRLDDWVENTFTFWSRDQVRRVLKKVQAAGLLTVRDEWDVEGVRTRFYAFKDQDDILEKTGAGKRVKKDPPKNPEKSSKWRNRHFVLKKQVADSPPRINNDPSILESNNSLSETSEQASSVEVVDKCEAQTFRVDVTHSIHSEECLAAVSGDNYSSTPPAQVPKTGDTPDPGVLRLNYEAPAVHLLNADHLERYARLSKSITPEFEDGILALIWAEHTLKNAARHNVVPEYYALLIAEARLEMGWDHSTMKLLFEFASSGTDRVLFDCTVTPYRLLSEWSTGMTLLETIKSRFVASKKGKTLRKRANLKAALDVLDMP